MALQCLTIVGDRETAAMLSTLLIEAGVTPTLFDDADDAFDTLQDVKFDAIFLDCDLAGVMPRVAHLRRQATLNRTVIVLAVSHDEERLHEAARRGADIVLRKPLALDLARKSVQLARSLMTTERRRYFRFPVEGFAELRVEKDSVPAHLTNISEGGMAVHCKHELTVGARVEIEFYLPGENNLVHARAIVAWVKPGQRAGLRFEHFFAGSRKCLERWIQAQHADTIGR